MKNIINKKPFPIGVMHKLLQNTLMGFFISVNKFLVFGCINTRRNIVKK